MFAVPDRTVARHLMALTDDVPVGPGMPGLTVTAAAVYAALKQRGATSTARRYLTQAQVVEAVTDDPAMGDKSPNL